MDPRLQEMLDHHEIKKVLATYCHGCDRWDAVMMGGVYLQDSWDDHGRYKCTGAEFTDSITREMVETSSVCTHLLGQSLINVTGEEAGAETYFFVAIRHPGTDGGQGLTYLGGRYVDTLRRVNGAWKIKQRICVRDWSKSQDVTNDPYAAFNFVQGQQSGLDPSFAVLGLTHSGLPHAR